MKTLCFTDYFLLIKIHWNSFYFFIIYFITSSQIIAESFIILAISFLFSKLHVAGFQT